MYCTIYQGCEQWDRKSHCFSTILPLQLPLEELDVFRNRQVGDLEFLDLADRVHNCRMVAVAEAFADLRQAEGGQLLGELHRHLARPGD